MRMFKGKVQQGKRYICDTNAVCEEFRGKKNHKIYMQRAGTLAYACLLRLVNTITQHA